VAFRGNSVVRKISLDNVCVMWNIKCKNDDFCIAHTFSKLAQTVMAKSPLENKSTTVSQSVLYYDSLDLEEINRDLGGIKHMKENTAKSKQPRKCNTSNHREITTLPPAKSQPSRSISLVSLTPTTTTASLLVHQRPSIISVVHSCALIVNGLASSRPPVLRLVICFRVIGHSVLDLRPATTVLALSRSKPWLRVRGRVVVVTSSLATIAVAAISDVSRVLAISVVRSHDVVFVLLHVVSSSLVDVGHGARGVSSTVARSIWRVAVASIRGCAGCAVPATVASVSRRAGVGPEIVLRG
jgi:hypothetical protein